MNFIVVPPSFVLVRAIHRQCRGKTAAEVGDYLNEQGIAVRSGLHCAPMAHRLLNTPEGGAVRASLGMFTTEAEISALWRALRDC